MIQNQGNKLKIMDLHENTEAPPPYFTAFLSMKIAVLRQPLSKGANGEIPEINTPCFKAHAF